MHGGELHGIQFSRSCTFSCDSYAKYNIVVIISQFYDRPKPLTLSFDYLLSEML